MKDRIFICSLNEIKVSNFFVKWIDEWKDEVIVFLNKQNEIKIKSSICPHFGGEIIYDKKIKKLKCLWHDWKFCPVSGKCLTFPIKGKLNPYDFDVSPKPLKNYKSITFDEKIYAIKK
jgi:nitrite reductase/ring-hydroxylating ferredoxin subunit